MRRLVTGFAVAVALLTGASIASADWSRPIVLTPTGRSAPLGTSAVAVDAHGDAAVAWETIGSWPVASHGRRCPKMESTTGCLPVSSVHLTVRTPDGRLTTRRLWSSRINPAMHLSVVLSHRAATVAWGYYNRSSTHEIAWVAYGPLIGHWGPSRTIGRFFDLASETYAAGKELFYPDLAAAPNGEVLAVLPACKSSTLASCRSHTGLAVRWRSPGHGFGEPKLVAAAPLGAGPQFDVHDTAYLSSSCSGRVLTTAPHSHSFTRSVLVAPGAVRFTLSLDGAGQGLAAWIAGACTTDPEVEADTPGPVLLSVLHDGSFAKPRALTPSSTKALYSNAVAVPGAGVVTWVALEGSNRFVLFSSPVGADGLPATTQQLAFGPAPSSADGGGDVVFSQAPPGVPTTGAIFVRPAGGGPDQPAPAPFGDVVAAAPVGRAAAVLWSGDATTLELSVWRP